MCVPIYNNIINDNQNEIELFNYVLIIKHQFAFHSIKLFAIFFGIIFCHKIT